MIEHRMQCIKILALARKLQDPYWQWEGHAMQILNSKNAQLN